MMFVCTLCASAPAFAWDNSAARGFFDQGNAAYVRQNYDQALSHYQQCLASAESAALHYNLANTYAQINATGPAILHYEKALALAPHFTDARANRDWLRNQAQLPEPQQTFIEHAAEQLSVRTWILLGTASFWLALALGLFLRLGYRQRPWGAALLAGCCLLFLTTVTALIGYHLKKDTVVILADADLRVAPAQESPGQITLQAGELGTIQKRERHYYLIQTRQGRLGWLSQDEVGVIWQVE